jgi:hypothetical protein
MYHPSSHTHEDDKAEDDDEEEWSFLTGGHSVLKIARLVDSANCKTHDVLAVFQGSSVPPDSMDVNTEGTGERMLQTLLKSRVTRPQLSDRTTWKLLGEGHFSEVHEAKHESHGGVAIKNVKSDKDNVTDDRDGDLLREMFHLKNLNDKVSGCVLRL